MTDNGAEDLSWIPQTCPNGHPLGPGRMTLSWTPCQCPRGMAGEPRQPGHHNASCNRCTAEVAPPDCDRPVRTRRS